MDRRPFTHGPSGSTSQMKQPTAMGGIPSTAVQLEEGPSQSRAALEPTVYIKIDEEVDNSITLVIPVGAFEIGETKLTKSHCLKIRSILEEKLKCKKQLKMVLSRAVSVQQFNRLWESVSPNAMMFEWKDPYYQHSHMPRTTTFFVKRVGKGQRTHQVSRGSGSINTPGVVQGVRLTSRIPVTYTNPTTSSVERLPGSSRLSSGSAIRHSVPAPPPGRVLQNKPKSKPVEVIDIESSSGDTDVSGYSVSETSDDDEDLDEKDEEDFQKHQKMYLDPYKNVSVTVTKSDMNNKGKPLQSSSAMKSVSQVPAKGTAMGMPVSNKSSVPKSNISGTSSAVGSSKLQTNNQTSKQESGTGRTSVMVVKGGRIIQNKKILWRLPGKTVVPSRKKIQTLYKIPIINDFQRAHYNPKKCVTYEYHPFLGKEVVVAVPPLREEDCIPPPIKKQKSQSGSENTAPSSKKAANITKVTSEESGSSSESEDDRRRLRSRQAKAKNNSSISTKPNNKKPAVPDKRQNDLGRRTLPERKKVILQEMTDSSSSSGSSSGSSDSSSSSGDSEPEFVKLNSEEERNLKLNNKTAGKSRNPLSSNSSNIKSNSSKNLRSQAQNQPPPPPVRRYDKGYPIFSQVDPNMPLRKDSEGRIHFDTTSRLKPSEYHTNEDTFVNWDKFVRNESGVGSFFKTIVRHKQSLCFLIIFHLTYDENTFAPKVDRSIELCSDGSVKIFLEGLDFTPLFFSYMDIRTNHDLMAMLLNLQHAYTCPGAGSDLDSVQICPSEDHVLRNNQWFSANCKSVVFDPDYASFKIKSRCGPCNTLRRNLCLEKTEIEKSQKASEILDRKKSKKVQKLSNTKIVREKQPEPVKLQVRESLTDFLKQMWRDLGLSEFQEEAQLPEVDEKPSIENEEGEVIESSSVPPVGEEVSVKEDGGTGINLPIQEGIEVSVSSSASNQIAVSESALQNNSNNPYLTDLSGNTIPFKPPTISSETPDLLTLSDLTFSSAEMNAMIPEDFQSLEMMINSSSENSSLLFGDAPLNSYSHQHHNMQPPMSVYPPQELSNHNFVYSQEAMDVTSTTGSLPGSIMSSGVFGGPVNPNIAIPVEETPPVVPNPITTDSSSLAGAISMSLLFPTFEDML